GGRSGLPRRSRGRRGPAQARPGLASPRDHHRPAARALAGAGRLPLGREESPSPRLRCLRHRRAVTEPRYPGPMATPPSPKLKVLVSGASLRAESLNRRLAALAARSAAAFGATVDLASMREFDVPLCDGDVEAGAALPAGAEALRR